jgi:hypothetical protein
MRRLWLVLCVIGTIVPYVILIPWLVAHGLDLGLLIQEATSSPIAAFAWLDVLISAVVVILLAVRQIRTGRRSMWFVILGTCAVGVSLGLPLYLYLRESSGMQV